MTLSVLHFGFDLDIARTTGDYVIDTPQNGPADVTQAFLQVSSVNVSGVRRVIQIVTDLETGTEYHRTRTSAGWSSWRARGLDGDTGGGAPILRVYTADDTWTKPEGLVRLEVWGVGGGGGTPNVTAATSQISLASGGGSGSYGLTWIEAASLNATEAVVIGAAGTAASTSGGTTSFGSHLTLPGAGATVAALASGTLSASTGNGTQAAAPSGHTFGVRGGLPPVRGRRFSGTFGVGGSGANSPLGIGGIGGGPGEAGTAPTGYGAGAGGSCSSSSTPVAGVTAAPGVLFVREHY